MKMEKRVYITRNTTFAFPGFLLLCLYISDVAPFSSLAVGFSDTRYTLLYDLYIRWMGLSSSL